jgi:hypothetical protein
VHHAIHCLAYGLILAAEALRFPMYESAKLGGYGMLTLAAFVAASHGFWHYLLSRRAKRKKEIMTTESERPIFRIAFSRIMGKDEKGDDILSRPKEIGAVWAQKKGKAGALVSLDLIPVELAQRQGVIFLLPIDRDDGTVA